MATAAHDARINRGQRLRRIRLDRHLTQAQLAARVGVTANQISRYERGHDDPGLDVLDRLLDVLEIRYEDLRGPVIEESPGSGLARRGKAATRSNMRT